METAILVDWDLFRSNPYTQDFITQRVNKTRMVLLVANPTRFDYTPETDPDDHTHGHHAPHVNWDAVVRNTGGLPNVGFKATALSVIQDASNLVPVIGLDANHEVNLLYREGGILITVDDL